MFTALMPNPKQQFFNNNGLPLISGKVYTYAAGTSNPKATFSDEAGTVPQANPIVLNIRGEPANPIRWIGSYRVEVRDFLGNLVYTVDDFQTPVNPDDLLSDDGAGIVGFDYTLNYPVSTIGAWLKALATSLGAGFIGFLQDAAGAVLRSLQSKGEDTVSVFDFMSIAQRAAVRTGLGALDVTAPMQSAANHGGSIKVPRGTYFCGSIDLKGRAVWFDGEGVDKTIIKANGTGVMFDAQDIADQVDLPFGITNMYLDGNGTATAGIKTRFRHKTIIDNLVITDINGDCLNELNSWNNQRNNLALRDSINGLVLQGANNNCAYNGLSISGHSQYQIKIEDGGTPAGGSTGLSFNQTDVEYAPGYGIYVKTHGVVRFNDCYLGEQITGPVFDMVKGMVEVTGGFSYFGTTALSYLGYMTGGKLYFRNVNITGAAFATVSNMFYSGAGHAYVEDSPCYLTVTGTQVMTGDVLDYGRGYDCFAPKLGRLFTGSTLNGTNSSATVDNELTVTCMTATGVPCIMEVSAAVDNKWLRNKAGSLVVVYKSNKDITAKLTSGPVGTTPDIDVGILPSTGGAVKTAVIFSWVYFSNDGGSQDMTTLELLQLGTVPGDTFTIYEVFLYDAKQGKSDVEATFYNLAKC